MIYGHLIHWSDLDGLKAKEVVESVVLKELLRMRGGGVLHKTLSPP